MYREIIASFHLHRSDMDFVFVRIIIYCSVINFSVVANFYDNNGNLMVI